MQLREAQKNLRDFIEQTNQNEDGTILRRDYGREKIYDNSATAQNGSAAPVSPANVSEGNLTTESVEAPLRAENAVSEDRISENIVDNSGESGIIEEKTKIMSFEDAKNELINAVGFQDVDSSIAQIDKKLLSENVEQLKRLENKFGIIHKSVSSIISKPNDTAYAVIESSRIYPTKQTLNLCTDSYDNRYKHLVFKRSDQREKWNMPCSKENLPVYTVTHEYGHMLQHYLIQKQFEAAGWLADNPEKFIDKWSFNDKEKYEWYNIRRREFEKQCLKEIFEIAKKNNYEINPFNILSEYGRQNDSESFAEIFANSQLGKPNVLGEAMLIWLAEKGLIINEL